MEPLLDMALTLSPVHREAPKFKIEARVSPISHQSWRLVSGPSLTVVMGTR